MQGAHWYIVYKVNKMNYWLTSFQIEYKKVIVWIVLPRPISSARIVFVPWAQENRNQFNPSNW